MSVYFKKINEQNKFSLCKPNDCNTVYYSELTQFQTINAFRNFSIKYVLDQKIDIKIGARLFTVPSGWFMLGNKQPCVKASSASDRMIKSICIDINIATLAEAFAVLSAKEDPDLDNFSANYFTSPSFFENMYKDDASPLGVKLKALASQIKADLEAELTEEWFLDLVEKLVVHEKGNQAAISNLDFVKASTRKELLYRLMRGREYMDDNFLNCLDIKGIAQAANVSEFHFYRSFKQAFKITPHQYLLKRRLAHSKALLAAGHANVKGVAMICGFPDAFTFSKAFKKFFGFSPSMLLKKTDLTATERHLLASA